MRPDDLVRLQHMRDSALEAVLFSKRRSRSDLDSDRILLLALVKCIEIIGEAASKVSADTRAQLPGIPWQEIVTMRHRLIHAYFDIDQDIVWSTIIEDIPPLIAVLDVVLPST